MLNMGKVFKLSTGEISINILGYFLESSPSTGNYIVSISLMITPNKRITETSGTL